MAAVPIKLTWHDELIDWLATGPAGIPRHSPGTVLAVASARMRYASRNGTECYPTIRWLADLLGYHHNTVEAVDRFLEANGWLILTGTRGRQRTPAYRLTVASTDATVKDDGGHDGGHDGGATVASTEATTTEPPNHRSSIQDLSFPPPGRNARDANNGGREPHGTEPNARAALTRLIAERRLPFTVEYLLDLAYTLDPNGDPFYGYMHRVKPATEKSFDGAHDPTAVLRKRLGLA
jgi:hypothetical protein